MASEKASTDVPFWTSCRVMLAVVGFIGTMNLYALRMNMSVGILCMTNHTAIAAIENITKVDQNTSVDSEGESQCGLMGSAKELDGEFAWDKKTRGLVLGIFFWGYLVTQIPAGIAVQKIGAKWPIFGFMLVTALATILVPMAARLSLGFLLALRVFIGMGSGVWFPAFHHLWSHWAPPGERSKLVGFTYAGLHIGNAFTLPVAGLLCQYGPAGGWPSVFYIFGSLGVVWCFIWAALIHDGPTKHPRITAAEKNYIVESLQGQVHDSHTKVKVPIFDFAKSLPVWSIIIMNVCFDWNGYLFLTSVPSYMKDVLKFDISSNGGLSALPFLGLWAGQISAVSLSNFIEKRQVLNTTWTRKLMNSIGMFGPMVLLLILAFMTCESKYVAVGVLTVALYLKGGVFLGCFINHVDIAPRYAGVLFAISNSIASVTGFFAPYMVGALTGNSLASEWRVVFYISAAVYLFGGGFFLLFASGDLQSWARDDEEDNCDKYSQDHEIEIVLEKKASENNLIEDADGDMKKANDPLLATAGNGHAAAANGVVA